MNPQDAVAFLDCCAGRALMSREDHVKARFAAEVLKTALQKETTDARPE